MSKAIYIGSSDLARKLSKCYVGDGNNLARKATKWYIGDVNGLARLGYSAERVPVITYRGLLSSSLTQYASCIACTYCPSGNIGLFGGGKTRTSMTSRVTGYNTSLTQLSGVADLSYSVYGLMATYTPHYMLFGGGRIDTSGTAISAMNAYNTSGTKFSCASLSSSRSFRGATSIGEYALIGGATINCFNDALTNSVLPSSPANTNNCTATSIGNYALFAGGGTDVDAYSSSLVWSSAPQLSYARTNLASASGYSHALFLGGYDSEYLFTRADAYTSSLSKVTCPELINGRYDAAAASQFGCVLLGGGVQYGGSLAQSTESYSDALTLAQQDNIQLGRESPCALGMNGYVLFGGGSSGSTYYSSVEYFMIRLSA